MALRPHLSVSSSFSSIPTMYYKQFSKCLPCAGGLRGELCNWMDGVMQHDCGHSSGLMVRIDRSFYDMYDMTDLNCDSKFRL